MSKTVFRQNTVMRHCRHWLHHPASFIISRGFAKQIQDNKDGYRQLNVHQLCSLPPCLSNDSQHVHSYLQPFTRYSDILVGNCNLFRPPFHLTPPYGVAPGSIVVNVTRIEREFNGCQTPRSMYPSVFNHF